MSAELNVETWRARGIAAAVAARRLDPADVAACVLERIDATEDRVQAFSQYDPARIEEQAGHLSDEAAQGRLRGPLHGVPVAVKEWFDVEGFPTLMKGPDSPPEPRDSTVVERLRDAGAIIVGKTHVPRGTTPAPTRNPWNLDHSPGGSSSGSAAAVAARVVPMTISEQTGGSTLRPAAFCGLAAIKATYGVISRAGQYTGVWSRDHPGVMALDMQDVALGLSVVGGYDPRDPTTIEQPAPPADLAIRAIRPPRLGLIRNFFPERTEPEMLAAVESSARRFADAGGEVLDLELPEEFAVAWDAISLQNVETATARAREWAEQGPVTLGDLGSGTVAAGGTNRRITELLPATYYLQVRRIRTWLSRLVSDQMTDQGLDGLLLACTPEVAPHGLSSTGSLALLIPWSFLGLPAITLSAGLSEAGLPQGLQLVGRPRHDHDLMRVGHWCEDTLGVLPAPEGIRPR